MKYFQSIDSGLCIRLEDTASRITQKLFEFTLENIHIWLRNPTIQTEYVKISSNIAILYFHREHTII